ncbi:GNAT family N-acetyltransferase [Pseudovibrio exalbescens]|uniref:GNAT family N-acetyltransferase n=1 Tax=Pseudovibrio exalbescens TaxID=197461 RepID=UPI0023650DAE|nr:GNAT family N-acetyltransferase [Pseudovibrio exalbescens]MDD7910974.1 GNAT family N-acetyltransferase [Pseudovibrio exalbescens]
MSAQKQPDLVQGSAVSLGTVKGFHVSIRKHWQEVRADWQALLAVAQTCPFQESGWMAAWCELTASHHHAPLLFVMVHDGPELLGMVPLHERRFAGHKVLAWQGDDVNDYCAPLVAPRLFEAMTAQDWEQVLQRVASHVGGVHGVLLRSQPAVLGGRTNPFAQLGSHQQTGIAHHLAVEWPWPRFYAGLRGKNTRRRLAQKHRKLKTNGPVHLRGLRRACDRAAAVALMLRWKADQLDERGSRNPFRTACGAPTKLTEHLQAAVNQPEALGSMRVYGLFVGEQMIAGFLCFAENKRLSVLINAFNKDAYREHSPGQLLLIQTMELAARAGITHYDLMRGDEAYKREWARDHTILIDSMLPITLRGQGLALLHKVTQRAKRAALKRPRVMAFLYAANRASRHMQRALLGREKDA